MTSTEKHFFVSCYVTYPSDRWHGWASGIVKRSKPIEDENEFNNLHKEIQSTYPDFTEVVIVNIIELPIGTKADFPHPAVIRAALAVAEAAVVRADASANTDECSIVEIALSQFHFTKAMETYREIRERHAAEPTS